MTTNIDTAGRKLKHIDVEDFFRSTAQPAAVGARQAQIWIDGLKNGVAPGYKTGISGLDQYLRLLPSTYLSIGARAGVGKTSLGMQLIENVEVQRQHAGDQSVTFVASAEMDARTLMARMAAKNCGVSLHRVQMAEAKPHELDAFSRELDRLADEVRFWIDETSAPTIEHMIEQLSIVAEEYTIGMVLFDYVELAGERERSEALRVASINRGLKRIAKKFDCPVIGLSQLSRDIEKRADRKPKPSDLMQGGEREPDAIIMLVEDDTDSVPAPSGYKFINGHIVKNRNGPTGVVPLLFDGARTKFLSAEVERTEITY